MPVSYSQFGWMPGVSDATFNTVTAATITATTKFNGNLNGKILTEAVDVTGSRAYGTVYQNGTDFRVVLVLGDGSFSGYYEISPDNLTWYPTNIQIPSSKLNECVVPPSWYYKVSRTAGSITKWYERG